MSNSSNKPTHDLFIVTGDGQSAEWTRVAGLWPTRDGNGFTGKIPSNISVTGKLVIQPRRAED